MTRDDLRYLRKRLRHLINEEGLRPTSNRTGIPVGQIRSLLSGRAALTTTVSSVCASLGLEFYIGPPRQLRVPVTGVAERTVQYESQHPVATERQAWTEELEEELRPSIRTAVERVLARHTVEAEISARQVEVRELAAAAGGGAVELEEQVVGFVSFQRSWLDSHGLDPTRCTVITITGDSMEPSLPNGSKILVDRAQCTLHEGRIYVVRSEEGLIVKRAALLGGRWSLRSDNSVYQDRPWSEEAVVIGEVRWVARTL